MSALQSASPEPDAVTGDESTPSAAAPKTSGAAKSASAAKAAKGKARPKPNSRAKAPAAPRRQAAAWPAPKPQATRPEVTPPAATAPAPPVEAAPPAEAVPPVEAASPAQTAPPVEAAAPAQTAPPVEAAAPAQAVPVFEPVVDPPVEAEMPAAPAPEDASPAVAYEALTAPQPPVVPAPPAAPAAYEPPAAPQPPVVPAPPVAPAAYEPPAAPQPPVVPAPPVAPAAYEPPAAPQPPVAPAAYEPPVAPQPPVAPAPVSLAGADIPAALGSAMDLEPPVAAPVSPEAYATPTVPEPHATPETYAPEPHATPETYAPEPHPAPETHAVHDAYAAPETYAVHDTYASPGPDAAPAAPQPPVAPVAPQPPVAPVAPVAPQAFHETEVVALDQPLEPAAEAPAYDPSTAPPGFTGAHILAAESPSLLALDPSDTEEEIVDDAPVATAAPATDPDGGSAILGRLRALLPGRATMKQFGRDKQATAHVVGTVVVAVLLLALFGGQAVRALSSVPIIGPAFAQLESFSLFPKAYGYSVWIAFLGTVTVAGIVVVQLERTADRFDRRQDPVTRLNIALAGMVTLALCGALLTFLSANGWAAAAAATSFFLAACLAVPALRLPGARAMQFQPERAWALLLVISLLSYVVCPSLPMLATIVVAALQVRKRWDGISAGEDLHQDGPIDSTNRLSAVLLTVFVLLAASIGMQAMTASPDDLRSLTNEDTTSIDGTRIGPDVAPPKP